MTGQVVDERGRPIAGATVAITGCDAFDEKGDEPQPAIGDFRAPREGVLFLPEEFVTTSAPDGRFAFKSVAPGRYCSFSVKHPDYVSGSARVATSEEPRRESGICRSGHCLW